MTARRFALHAAIASGLLGAIGVQPASAQSVQLVRDCLTETVAALRMSDLAKAIASCDEIANNTATSRDLRGQALGQRGLLYAKRWSLVEIPQDAQLGITDITDALQAHAFPKDRKQHLLTIRGQLYQATGQTRRAVDDFKAVLTEAPNNEAARAGLRKAGTPDSY